jgi:hypothetical protein
MGVLERLGPPPTRGTIVDSHFKRHFAFTKSHAQNGW